MSQSTKALGPAPEPERLETDYVVGESEPEPEAPIDADAHTHGARPTLQGVITSQLAAERRPILPGWLRSWSEFRRNVSWLRRHWLHVLVFHFVRIPAYATKAAWRFPRGLLRIVRVVGDWLLDGEARSLRAQAALTNKPDEWRKLAQVRDERFRKRCYALGLAALLLVVAASVFWAKAGEQLRAGVLVLAVLGLAQLGSPADRPLMAHAVTSSDAPRLTSDVIIRALMGLGIAGITQGQTKGSSPIVFVAPITRDNGMGWRADVDLPHGVTAGDVQEKRGALASGLRRNMGCVWPESDPHAHPGRLVLFVGDRPLSEQRPPVWPLLKAGQTSLFKPIPFGFDQRGRQVDFTLMFTNLLIGSMPRYGKTYTVREVLLACGLDPTAELRLYELKGTGDLSAFEPIAHRYASGPDDETIGRLMVDLREVYALLETRATTIRGLPRALVPEFKVTPELAARRQLGLFPLVFAVDECQELFSHPVYGKEAEALCTAIIKRGPALGIILVLATQRPDAKSLPTGVSSNAGTRFCLRVMGHVEADMVLGAGASKNGFKPQLLSPQERGVGYLAGVFDEPRIVRTYKLDGDVPDRIIERALAIREAAGTLSGHAIGAEPEDGEREARTTVLVDVLGVWPADEPKASSARLAELLSSRLAGRYLDWQGPDLTRALTARGVRKGQVWVDGRNLQGFVREDVSGRLEALAEISSTPERPALSSVRSAS